MLPVGTVPILAPATSSIEVTSATGAPVVVEVTCPALTPEELFGGDGGDAVAPIRCGTEAQQVCECNGVGGAR